MLEMLASASWQDPDNFTKVSTSADIIVDFFPYDVEDIKPSDTNWRILQKHCWTKYKTFGPLNAAVNSKADYVAGAGFSIYSDILDVNEFLKGLFNSTRNKLYARIVSWIIRMLVECELFILLVFDEEGNVTIRNFEPTFIGDENDNKDSGIINDPDDTNTPLFYRHKTTKGFELIPDANFILEPEWMLERAKAAGTAIKKELIHDITKGAGKYKKIGGYRRFVLHWKNLTGEMNIHRDTSSIATTLEWINLYIMALKWELDYKKALCAYTIDIGFTDTPAGKIAYQIWNKMSQQAKEATGLLKPLTPGSKIFRIPGMEIKIHAPQLSALSGSNQDLLNLSGSGARTPQDLWQGQSAGATYGSLRTSRPPLVMEIDNLQFKLENFLRYELLRYCLQAKLAMGGTIQRPGNKKYKLQETYKQKWSEEVIKGKAKLIDIEVEPCEIINFTFPAVQLDANAQEKANAYMGSKHAGIYSLGVSANTIARRFGIDGLSREKRRQLIEEEEYGKPVAGTDAEQNTEQKFKEKGVEGGIDDKEN